MPTSYIFTLSLLDPLPILQLSAAGGVTPYAWAITGGALPAGVGINSTTGLISGTPTASGTFPFTAQVTDAASQTATFTCNIVIASAVAIINSGSVGQVVN